MPITTTSQPTFRPGLYETLQGIEVACETLAACTDAELAYEVHSHQSMLLKDLGLTFAPKWCALLKVALDDALAEALAECRRIEDDLDQREYEDFLDEFEDLAFDAAAAAELAYERHLENGEAR